MANNCNDGSSGVSKCYIFKSRLQEYAQKANLSTPVYETIKEGPSHEPSFRSTVIVNDVRYNSLPGFFNRKAAEQSAAEVALVELTKTGEVSESISQPVHETGLCKNLLQEYAQKMNFAIPLYKCQKEELSGRWTLFTCSVKIGGIRYIGGSAKKKKEAEIKAARTALLAIQSSASESSHRLGGESQLTVLPSKKRGLEAGNTSASRDADDAPKPKQACMKEKGLKIKHRARKAGNSQAAIAGNTGSLIAVAKPSTFSMGWPNAAGKAVEVDGSSVPVVNQIIDPTSHCQPGGSVITSGEMEKSAARVHHTTTVNVVLVNQDMTAMTGMPSAGYEDVATFLTERNAEAWAGRVGSLSGNHTHAGNLETSSSIILTGFDQSGERIQACAN